ncbi:MAG: acyltransferase [Ardenticatenaceae bacterium]|nr:acyltransferase [Ardenticatenaceae bacterium]MCB9444797.1 acyltransferase [Ardenticatenaceae bacterium]
MIKPVWPKRLYLLDVSRGFAALAVVLWHWQHFSYEGTELPVNFERSGQPLYAYLKLFYEKGEMGVYYFFLLSGFIFFWLYRIPISKKSLTLKTFLLQRFSRLYPLHFVTLLMVAFLQFLYISRKSSFFVYPFNDAYHFLLNVFFASDWGFERGWSFNAPVWSVSIEILLYIIFFFVVYANRSNPLSYLLVSAAAFITSFILHHDIFRGLSMFFLGGFVFHFLLIMSADAMKYRAVIYYAALSSWLLVFVNFYVFEITPYISNLSSGSVLVLMFPYYVLFPLTVCAFALIEIDKGMSVKRISWIGDITYSSYLLHFPLQIVFGLAASRGIIKPFFYTDPVYLMIFFAFLVPLSYVTFQYFERPMQNAIRNKLITP